MKPLLYGLLVIVGTMVGHAAVRAPERRGLLAVKGLAVLWGLMVAVALVAAKLQTGTAFYPLPVLWTQHLVWSALALPAIGQMTWMIGGASLRARTGSAMIGFAFVVALSAYLARISWDVRPLPVSPEFVAVSVGAVLSSPIAMLLFARRLLIQGLIGNSESGAKTRGRWT